MAKIKEEYSCSLLLIIDLIGGKWKQRILWHIIHGDNRFSLLQKGIPDITEKMLTTQLKELELNGLVERTLICKKPLNVQYRLSDDYSKLSVLIDELCEFAKDYGLKNDIIVHE
ncbi:MAG: helix-turn-helix domain-containing protein [Acidaminobacteraceae bacterium]